MIDAGAATKNARANPSRPLNLGIGFGAALVRAPLQVSDRIIEPAGRVFDSPRAR
jgi:hypothetical protein